MVGLFRLSCIIKLPILGVRTVFSKMPQTKKPAKRSFKGQLNLPNQFELKAMEMLLAIEQGKSSHRSGNIKSSGAPLEERIRSLLSESLPSTFKVASGYFYGASSQCSPEVDVLIYDDQEAFRLDPAPQDQHYVPYTSVSIMGQVKNSARDLPGAIDQVHKTLKAWHEMRKELLEVAIATGQRHQEKPLTFIVCGKSSDQNVSKLAATLKSKGGPYVDYILLLDRGLIIAGNYDQVEYDEPTIGFLQHRRVDSLHLCKPDGPPECFRGVALLWFYFAMVTKLNYDRGTTMRYSQFCSQIEALYPLRRIERLGCAVPTGN